MTCAELPEPYCCCKCCTDCREKILIEGSMRAQAAQVVARSSSVACAVMHPRVGAIQSPVLLLSGLTRCSGLALQTLIFLFFLHTSLTSPWGEGEEGPGLPAGLPQQGRQFPCPADGAGHGVMKCTAYVH